MTESVQFVDLPTIARKGGPRDPDPVVVNFLEVLKANPDKWAQWPIERKTKPEVPAGFKIARRGEVNYASYVGEEPVDLTE